MENLYMKKNFINKIEKILEDEKSSILEKFKQTDMSYIDESGDSVDAIQAGILALAISQLAVRDKEKLNRINNAMKKITEGTFGLCEECGESISEKRLLINPGFVTCIGCAEHLEILERKNRR